MNFLVNLTQLTSFYFIILRSGAYKLFSSKCGAYLRASGAAGGAYSSEYGNWQCQLPYIIMK